MNGLSVAFPKSIGWRDHCVGFLLALLYCAALLFTAHDLGFPRDEGFYFHAAADYAKWFELLWAEPSKAISQKFIDASWASNHEHPSLMKSLFALGLSILWEKWKLFGQASTCMRLPAIMMGGAGIWVTYLFGARLYGRRAGCIAAALLGLMPHVFFHAHLACFDVPIMTMWTLCIYVYYRSVEERKFRWIIALGLVYGLTLETKHNAWILPAVFIPHTILLLTKSHPAGAVKERLKILPNLLSMAALGPAVFIGLWPWMWNDTWRRVQEYVQFHVHHEHYNIEYFHKNYFSAPHPLHYTLVLIVATVPTITLLLFALGTADRLKELGKRCFYWIAKKSDQNDIQAGGEDTKAEGDVLLFLAAGCALGPFFLPNTPIFGGTKHWMTAYPFMAMLAGRGFELGHAALMKAIERFSARSRNLAEAGFFACALAAPLAITMHSHPFGISAYVPVVGGTRGGADLGFYRQFWGYTTQNADAYMRANAPKNGRIYFHDTAWDSWNRMVAEDRVRKDLKGVGSPSQADIGLIQYELHMAEVEHNFWLEFGLSPAALVTHDGVPFVGIYRQQTPLPR